jgi:hypothetical protein
MKMEQTEHSETLAYKLQMPGNYPKESIQHVEHGKSLKSGKIPMIWANALRTSNFACVMLHLMYLKADRLSIFIKF